MPTSSKKSTRTDLSALLEGLIEADVKFILVGVKGDLPPSCGSR